MSTQLPDEIKAKYVRLMGADAGEAFGELMQDAARLHLKWNEFLQLFAVSPGQIETLNRAAPGFFYLVSEAWWQARTVHNPPDQLFLRQFDYGIVVRHGEGSSPTERTSLTEPSGPQRRR